MLHSLQKKSLQTRAHVAFMIAFVVSMIIVVFWIVTLPTKLAEIREVNDVLDAARTAEYDAETTRNNQAATALLGELVASTTEVYHDLGSQLKDIGGTYTEEEGSIVEVEYTEASSSSDTIIIREAN